MFNNGEELWCNAKKKCRSSRKKFVQADKQETVVSFSSQLARHCNQIHIYKFSLQLAEETSFTANMPTCYEAPTPFGNITTVSLCRWGKKHRLVTYSTNPSYQHLDFKVPVSGVLNWIIWHSICHEAKGLTGNPTGQNDKSEPAVVVFAVSEANRRSQHL